jgi:hypothetical protein
MGHQNHVPEKGQALGLATLDGTGRVPVTQLPAATEALQGAAEIATQAEVDTGTDDLRFVTPLKLAQFTGLGGSIANYSISEPRTVTVEDDNVLQTTSTTDLVTDLTLTPGVGTYLVMVSAEGSMNKNSQTVRASVYANGTQVADSERLIGGQSNNIGNFKLLTIATVADAQAIDVRWHISSSAGGGTGTLGARALILLKIG